MVVPRALRRVGGGVGDEGDGDGDGDDVNGANDAMKDIGEVDWPHSDRKSNGAVFVAGDELQEL